MIRKFISLSNIGRFEAMKAHGDVEFKKFTLIFADNGLGKTTLCEVIRSLQTNNADILTGRKTLGGLGHPEAKILLTDGTLAEFKDGSWSRTPLGGVSIFDATYVRDNVHAGEVVDPTHRRNLFQVIVGAEGVRLATSVEALEKQRSDLNAPIRDRKKAIEVYVPNGVTLDAYLAAEADRDIDTKIANAEADLAAARKSEEIRRFRQLKPISRTELPETFLLTLDTSIETIAADAEKTLRRHVSHLAVRGAETWLAKGVDLVVDDTCPFCAKSLIGSDLIAAYRSCFSEAYRHLSDTVTALERALATALGPNSAAQVETALTSNLEVADWWKDYVGAVDAPIVDLGALRTATSKLLDCALEMVRQKRDNMMAAVFPSDGFTEAAGALAAALTAVDTYNNHVGIQNEVITRYKDDLAGADPVRTQSKLRQLQALKQRFEPPLAEACAGYLSLLSQRDELGRAKEEAKTALAKHTAKVVGPYEVELNRLLGKFMSGFQVRGTKTDFPKGMPSSSYRLVINNVEVEVGSETSPDSLPSFKNTLSGGDRSALALALFMAQLAHRERPAEIAVVLDDPFQSQDAFRRTATAFQIKRAGDSARQVVVMSHDPHFLKLVWDELPDDQRKALRLHAVGRTSTMSEWDIYEHLRSDHQRNLTAMQRYIDDGRGEPRDVARLLRLALEGHCKLVAYGEFAEKDMMGDIISVVRTSGSSHVLYGILDDLEELNSYARRYHHATNLDAATEPFNEAELQSYTRQILALMRIRTIN